MNNVGSVHTDVKVLDNLQALFAIGVLAESLGELPQGTLLDDEALSDAEFSQTGSGSDQPPHPPPDAVKVAVREEEEYVEPEPVEDQEEAGRQVLSEGGYRPLRSETSSRCG